MPDFMSPRAPPKNIEILKNNSYQVCVLVLAVPVLSSLKKRAAGLLSVIYRHAKAFAPGKKYAARRVLSDLDLGWRRWCHRRRHLQRRQFARRDGTERCIEDTNMRRRAAESLTEAMTNDNCSLSSYNKLVNSHPRTSISQIAEHFSCCHTCLFLLVALSSSLARSTPSSRL